MQRRIFIIRSNIEGKCLFGVKNWPHFLWTHWTANREGEKSANVDIASYICRPDTSIETMKTIQFREAVCEAMSEEMRRDENIY